MSWRFTYLPLKTSRTILLSGILYRVLFRKCSSGCNATALLIHLPPSRSHHPLRPNLPLHCLFPLFPLNGNIRSISTVLAHKGISGSHPLLPSILPIPTIEAIPMPFACTYCRFTGDSIYSINIHLSHFVPELVGIVKAKTNNHPSQTCRVS